MAFAADMRVNCSTVLRMDGLYSKQTSNKADCSPSVKSDHCTSVYNIREENNFYSCRILSEFELVSHSLSAKIELRSIAYWTFGLVDGFRNIILDILGDTGDRFSQAFKFLGSFLLRCTIFPVISLH